MKDLGELAEMPFPLSSNQQDRRNIRVIARLDVKGSNLIKGIHLEGIRKIGSPNEFALRYYNEGIDEILFMDAVASLYGRNQMIEIVRETATQVFVPITVGGGVRSVEDFEALLNNGADKVAINTAAIRDPGLLSRLATRFGSQSVVLSIEALQVGSSKWEALTDKGRQRTGRDVIEWVREATFLGIGEVLITSIDKEGTRAGFDIELMKAVGQVSSIPTLASGGMGCPDHLIELANSADVDGIVMADVLHFHRYTLNEIRTAAIESGIELRAHE